MTNFETPNLVIRGFKIFKERLDLNIQNDLISDLREIVKVEPLFSPHVPGGNKMSVKMTSAGKYGWFSDSKGYRYVSRQKNGNNWPQIPNSIMEIWQKFVSLERNPDCCLINYYSKDAKMGMHQDNDEADFDWPVLSISLGDDALFRIGILYYRGKTYSLRLFFGVLIFVWFVFWFMFDCVACIISGDRSITGSNSSHGR